MNYINNKNAPSEHLEGAIIHALFYFNFLSTCFLISLLTSFSHFFIPRRIDDLLFKLTFIFLGIETPPVSIYVQVHYKTKFQIKQYIAGTYIPKHYMLCFWVKNGVENPMVTFICFYIFTLIQLYVYNVFRLVIR